MTAEQIVAEAIDGETSPGVVCDAAWLDRCTLAVLAALREAGYNLDGPDIGQMLDVLLFDVPNWREAVAAAWTALQESET